METLEDLHKDRTNISFPTIEAEGEGWDPIKLAYAPQ